MRSFEANMDEKIKKKIQKKLRTTSYEKNFGKHTSRMIITRLKDFIYNENVSHEIYIKL